MSEDSGLSKQEHELLLADLATARRRLEESKEQLEERSAHINAIEAELSRVSSLFEKSERRFFKMKEKYDELKNKPKNCKACPEYLELMRANRKQSKVVARPMNESEKSNERKALEAKVIRLKADVSARDASLTQVAAQRDVFKSDAELARDHLAAEKVRTSDLKAKVKEQKDEIAEKDKAISHQQTELVRSDNRFIKMKQKHDVLNNTPQSCKTCPEYLELVSNYNAIADRKKRQNP